MRTTKNILCFLLVLVSLVLTQTVLAQGAKKPHLMVVPSDALLNQMGLLKTTQDMGAESYVQDYRRAFLDTDLKACVSKISEMMADRGFPIEMLERRLADVQNTGLPIPVDLRLELNYRLEKQGPRRLLYYEISAVDAYSSKQVAASSGESAPSIGNSTVLLLQEAVLNHFEKFSNDLQRYFEGLAAVGRESRLKVKTSGTASLEEELGGQSLSETIEAWLEQNCVKRAYTIDEQDDEFMNVSQSMMPLFGQDGKALDAYNFYRPLQRLLSQKCAARGWKVHLARAKGGRGLGEVLITVSDDTSY